MATYPDMQSVDVRIVIHLNVYRQYKFHLSTIYSIWYECTMLMYNQHQLLLSCFFIVWTPLRWKYIIFLSPTDQIWNRIVYQYCIALEVQTCFIISNLFECYIITLKQSIQCFASCIIISPIDLYSIQTVVTIMASPNINRHNYSVLWFKLYHRLFLYVVTFSFDHGYINGQQKGQSSPPTIRNTKLMITISIYLYIYI